MSCSLYVNFHLHLHIMHLLFCLCFLLVAQLPLSSSFDNTMLTFPLGQNTNDPFLPLEFVISFTTSYEIVVGEVIYINLPQFTRKLTPELRDYNNSALALDMTLGQLIVSPSMYFNAGWEEGRYDFSNSTMYAGSRIKLTPRLSTAVPTYTEIALKIYKGNGIGVICGFAGSEGTVPVYKNADAVFQITSSIWTSEVWPIESYDSFGIGCSAYKDCNNHGRCDFCRQKCMCDQGFGSDMDVLLARSSIDASCSQRVCPSGKSILSLPSVDGTAHQEQAECSNAGSCNRETGECQCFPPYFGAACDKIGCPNSCSGHGQCMSMRNIAEYFGKTRFTKRTGTIKTNALYDYPYGTPNSMTFGTWDADIVHGCVCDSSWTVGYDVREYQLAEYFGADCSLKRCPSGDDPMSGPDEQNCHRKNQVGSYAYGTVARGQVGNYCHVSCSNRGTCDHSTGTCSCQDGFYGDNCGLIANQGMKLYEKYIPLQDNLGSAFK